MLCPRDAHALQSLSVKGMTFQGCKTCKGLLVEHEAMQRLFATAPVPKRDDNYFKSFVSAAEFLKSNRALACPKCKYNMYETENRGIHLDFCLNCQAIWFDKGELQSIMQRLKQGEKFNLVPLPASEVDHASGLILHLLRDQWL